MAPEAAVVLGHCVHLPWTHPPVVVVVVDHTTAMVHSEDSEAAAAAVVPHQDCRKLLRSITGIK